MDYRKLLGKVESAVLPYFGGGTVDAPSRRLHLTTPVAPGWWRFEVKGRQATAREPASAEGLEDRPRVRGHLWGTRLVREGAVAEPLALMPEEEPPRLSPVTARRWHDGTLVFEGVEFESESEELARHALEEDRPLGEARGVGASLRAAFSFAVLEVASRGTGIPFAPVEARARVLDVARGGRAEAEACLRRLADERVRFVRMQAEQQARGDAEARALESARTERERTLQEFRQDAATRARAQERMAHGVRGGASAQGTWTGAGLTSGQQRRAEAASGEWAERALSKAGARMLDHRRLGVGLMEVVYSFMGERFVTVVEMATLRVRDAGVCLAGADDRVTLESLPSVLKEAIDTGALVITRHV
ncbi:hypothetical protein D7Y13_09040 [Corallococcus praedator]|uniref:Band 7 domain-containing protein n=1 Tax=Corallococcus praedator TaxID=2316724 RepID=A0ABX9QMI8_9BACT|nr:MULTISPECIES: hypothetical protein [Corallococcus]RKH32484.1 hypothetical protein D7X75_15735 [Corallococcus sp. CA031C]RKI12672.1 hypothetical protein D7Y13_09040 [Corallococcus praedator]